MVNFPTRIQDCDSHSPALLDLFISCDASICSTIAFPSLGNSDHVDVQIFINFSSNSQRAGPFHRMAQDCSCADLDGLCDHLRDVPWEDIFKLGDSAAASELKYISLTENIRSGLTHLHGFQLLVLLPQFIEIIFSVCTKRINLLLLKQSSDWLVIVAKEFLKLRNLHMLIKQKSPFLPRNLALVTFGELLIVFLTKVNLLYLLFSMAWRCCLLHLIKENCLLKTFLRIQIWMTHVSLQLFSLLELI